MDNREQLATRLENAEQGSRELGDKVLKRFGWSDRQIMQALDDGMLPNPTESVDDGLALAGDDWAKILGEAWDRLCNTDQGSNFTRPRLPLLISAALVRAAGAQKEDKSDG